MNSTVPQNYASVKDRLDEIVEAVNDDDISLDDALTLYEEAVKLGLLVSSLLEDDISETQVEAVLAEQESIEPVAETLPDDFETEGELNEQEPPTEGFDAEDQEASREADQESLEESDSVTDEE